MRVLLLTSVFLCATISYGQNVPEEAEEVFPSLHNGLTERIGNFSLELLYHTSKDQGKDLNLILSPITVWTVLAVISEGAMGQTAVEINNALRISARHRNATRRRFQEIHQWLEVNTTTVELFKVNIIFVDKVKLLERDYEDIAIDVYKTKVLSLNFSNSEQTADAINQGISKFTHGLVPKLVDSSDLQDVPMLLTSALYFKGQWTVPFNTSQTTKMPFYDSAGQKIGDVNMMYNRHTYPFSNIKALQARVIELPYGKENRLSMLIMLPNAGVTLESMFFRFGNVTLDTLFQELRMSKEEFADDEVDCFLPRFKIESNLDLTSVLKNGMGIRDMFDVNAARLPLVARTPLYVSKVIHKAVIEVTEDGTTAAGVTAAEFSNRIGIVSFVANRPFCYLIVEKVTNSIVFGGLYEKPSLF